MNIDLLKVDLVKVEKLAELGLLSVRKMSGMFIVKRSWPTYGGWTLPKNKVGSETVYKSGDSSNGSEVAEATCIQVKT